MSEAKVRVRVAHNAMHLPVVALRGLVVFPNNVVHFEVGRQKSIAAIEAAMHANSNIFLIAQKDMETEEPTAQDLYAYGVISEIKQVLRVSEDLVKVLVEGKSRAKLLDLDASGKYLQADVRPAPVRGVAPDKRTQTEALVRSLKECFEEYLSYSPQISKDVVYNIVSSDNPLYLSEYMPANLLLKYEDKQTILQENSIPSRLEKLLLVMRQECEVLAIEKELDDKVNVQMDKNQRDYYLREQMHIISEELGDAEDTRAEAEKYAQKIQDLHLDAASEEKLLKECERLGKMAGNQAEISVIRSYLDTVIGLPWHTFTKDDLNQAHARKVLDHDHYGLDKVKERSLEILAVRQLNTDVKGQIICLVGPPGVGKTSIARSVAACMDRNFARMSLGGVHDEAEIRGHRRTYIGAMPGRIISAINTAKSSNPVILLDEIDKLAGDYRGDPSSALLEVLDPEQNKTFKDNYLDIPFDLSNVLFITTANDASHIPAWKSSTSPAAICCPNSSKITAWNPALPWPRRRCMRSLTATPAKLACVLWSAPSPPCCASALKRSPQGRKIRSMLPLPWSKQCSVPKRSSRPLFPAPMLLALPTAWPGPAWAERCFPSKFPSSPTDPARWRSPAAWAM